jgi:hypothetical protein
MTASTPASGKQTSKTVDWEKVEGQYRAGTRSLREIATEHSITEGAIRKRAKRDDWARDLRAKVRAKADELVRKESVRSEVRTASAKQAEKQVIEVEATVQSRIRLAHRTDIARARTMGMHLMSEVEAQSFRPELFKEIDQLLAGIAKGKTLDDLPEDKQKAARALLSDGLAKALALGQRTATYKSLVDSLTRLVGLEREAYGITEDTDLEDPVTKLLHSLKARTFQPVADDPDIAP